MNLKTFPLLFLAVFAASLSGFTETTDISLLNQKAGIAIRGYDPVSYHNDKAVRGSKNITANYNGLSYWFSSEEHKQSFLENPDQYIPVYGGWCAYAMLEGKQVDVDPERYKVINGITYLFYDGFWGNTLKKWDDLLEETDESELIGKAGTHWKIILDK